MFENPLICDHCNIFAMNLYKIRLIYQSKPDKIISICRLCRKDLKSNKKFTRSKVKHDYKSSEQVVKKSWENIKN